MANHAQNEQLIRRYYHAMNARDFEQVWACFTDDVVYTDAALGESFNGLSAFRTFYLEYMLPLNVSVELEMVITTDSAFALSNRFSGKHVADLPGMPATGKSFSLPSATIGTIENGKIKTNTDYWNLYALLTQLGLVATPTKAS
jgi:steroid delta-isomerase-like uncharacterized protein